MAGDSSRVAAILPLEMTQLLLIRHGETDWNLSQRFQGHLDVPLNHRGLSQAQCLAERLADEKIDAFYSSDLQRARQTAQPSAVRLGLELATSPALREQAFGILEGLSAAEIVERHPLEWANWLKFDPDFAPSGGESTRLFHSRVLTEVTAIAERHAGATVAIVTHGGVLDMIWRTVCAVPLEGRRTCAIPNAGLNRLRLRQGGLEIIEWADEAHLAELPVR
jgi:2,3-bisphosphoglycerate-dependent phosphoglycerate mutase